MYICLILLLLEVFPFVEHTCRVGPEECKVQAGDCAEYTRLRECCCHSYLTSVCKCPWTFPRRKERSLDEEKRSCSNKFRNWTNYVSSQPQILPKLALSKSRQINLLTIYYDNYIIFCLFFSMFIKKIVYSFPSKGKTSLNITVLILSVEKMIFRENEHVKTFKLYSQRDILHFHMSSEKLYCTDL